MAKATGLSQSAVARIWKAFPLQPHRVDNLRSKIRSSSTRCATSWGCTSPRRSAPWCCASMRKLKSKRWIAPPPSCRCGRAKPNGARTTRAPRDHDALCRAGRQGRRGHRGVSCPAPGARIPPVSRHDRGSRAGRPRRASDPRQLCDAKTGRDSSVAGQTAAVSRPFHARRVPRGSIWSSGDLGCRQTNSPGHASEYAGTGGRHPGLFRCHQRLAQALRLAQDRR